MNGSVSPRGGTYQPPHNKQLCAKTPPTTRTAPTQENVHEGGEKLILATDAVIKMERTVQLLLIPPQKQIAEL